MDEKNNVLLIELIQFIQVVIKYLLTRWFVILLISITGGIIGFYFALYQKPIYISKYSFILNENEGGTSLNLSSLAGIAGISGLGGSSNNVNEDKLLYLANSRLIIGESLLDNYEINGKKGSLVNHFIDIYELQKRFISDTSLINFQYFKSTQLEKLDYQENKVMDLIIKMIIDSKFLTIDTKKKTGIVIQSAGIIAMDYKSIDEEFSKYFIESLFNNLSNYYTNKSIQRQFKNYLLIQNRADSLKDVLYEKETNGANIYDRNIKIIKMAGRVDLERNKREIQILSLMYSEVLKNLEIAKFNLDNQTPFFQSVDKPTFPLEIKKKSKLILAIIGFVLLGGLFSLIIIIKNFKKLKASSSQLN
jgi:hypothetical protein